MGKRLHIKIYGAVQGVGFRQAAQRKARQWGLTGFVRNGKEGCVETEVDGVVDAVEKYRQWCRTGPPLARVLRVEEQFEAPNPKSKTNFNDQNTKYKAFRIL